MERLLSTLLDELAATRPAAPIATLTFDGVVRGDAEGADDVWAATASDPVSQWRSHAMALRFHLKPRHDVPLILAIVGGTGTGKSTLMNRLLGREVSATSFRRTFTRGPVAVAADTEAIPPGWLDLEGKTRVANETPVRGKDGELLVVVCEHALTRRFLLVDTPDLDGDHPSHREQADRAFRWAEAVLFLVTPEKYQMVDWRGYGRLALRYRVPSLFVMNKCEEHAVIEDFREQLTAWDSAEPAVFALPREDTAYEPPPEAGWSSLRHALDTLGRAEGEDRARGLGMRAMDLVTRLQDQVLGPLREARRQVDDVLVTIRAMEAAEAGVDVSTMTQQLQRRMQEQSVLYLMGPQRVLDRARQLPGMLARLPRTAWDFLAKGRYTPLTPPMLVAGPGDRVLASTDARGELPDFAQILVDQFMVVQSRLDDLLRAHPVVARWIEDRSADYQQTRIDPACAGRIADEEMAALRSWLEAYWGRKPRDTRTIEKLLSYLIGKKNSVQLSEVAPYLLTLVVVSHGAFFGPIDLLIIGGFSLATWLGEKLSNEVTARTRQANRRIQERFEELTRQQVDMARSWLERQAPDAARLDRIARSADDLAAEVQREARG